MSPRQCVVQDCDRISDPEVEISMHTSPLEGAVLSKWKRFVFQLCKNLKPNGQFGVYVHYTLLRTVLRVQFVFVLKKPEDNYVKTGSVAIVWKRESFSISGRSCQQVSESP